MSDMDEIESDWRVLNRRPFERMASKTVNATEAVERIVHALIEAHKVVGRTLEALPRVMFMKVMGGGWKVIVEPNLETLNGDKVLFQACEDLDVALESTFNTIQLYIQRAQEEHTEQADDMEKRLKDLRDKARKLDLIQQSMGAFWPKQALLPFEDTGGPTQDVCNLSPIDGGDDEPFGGPEDDDIPF